MADDLQSWFKNLPGKLQRELAGGLKEIADDLARDIDAEAPEGPTGNTRKSVRVRRGRNTLEFYVEAGGALTTKQASRSTRYVREVKIGSDDTQGIARGDAAGVSYDYALAGEFGTQKQPAQPWFYSTYNVRKDDIRQQIDDLVTDVLSKA